MFKAGSFYRRRFKGSLADPASSTPPAVTDMSDTLSGFLLTISFQQLDLCHHQKNSLEGSQLPSAQPLWASPLKMSLPILEYPEAQDSLRNIPAHI